MKKKLGLSVLEISKQPQIRSFFMPMPKPSQLCESADVKEPLVSFDESKKEEDETSEEVEGCRWNPKLSVIPGSPYVTITKGTDLQEYLGGDYIANTSSSSKDVGSTEVAPSDEKE